MEHKQNNRIRPEERQDMRKRGDGSRLRDRGRFLPMVGGVLRLVGGRPRSRSIAVHMTYARLGKMRPESRGEIVGCTRRLHAGDAGRAECGVKGGRVVFVWCLFGGLRAWECKRSLGRKASRGSHCGTTYGKQNKRAFL